MSKQPITEYGRCQWCSYYWDIPVNQGVNCPKCGAGEYLIRPEYEDDEEEDEGEEL